MRLLIDTHIFLWFVMSPSRLSAAALSAIQNSQNGIYLCVVSAWEMIIKSNLGKLNLSQTIKSFVQDQAQRNRFVLLPITLTHIAAVEKLSPHHRDPFGRQIFSKYPVNLIR